MEYKIITGVNPTNQLNELASQGWVLDHVKEHGGELVYVLSRKVSKSRTKTKTKA